jgi:hypothetical protein
MGLRHEESRFSGESALLFVHGDAPDPSYPYVHHWNVREHLARAVEIYTDVSQT